ncbi:hypothetical protein AC1031_002197 [Aphanomyces cochlioides]|nr:hypothetical protein AC1031_002197 [Aphanomyces cochlioides]
MAPATDLLDDVSSLIASDETLLFELGHVNDLFGDEPNDLEDSNSADAVERSVSLRTRRRKAPTHSYLRQRDEIMRLKRQVTKLQEELTAKKNRMPSRPVSKWERTAQLECMSKNKAMLENRQLKEALHEQLTFLEQMERVFQKKPQTSRLDTDDWTAYKLAAQASLRYTAIHAIADRQYIRMQSVFIQADVMHRAADLFHVRAIPRAKKAARRFSLKWFIT